MRRVVLFAACSALLSIAPAAAKAPPKEGTSPARLSKVALYEAAFADEVKRGAFDPFAHWTARPISVYFSAPGRVVLDYGQETEPCKLSASKSGAAFDVELTCGGATRGATWSWRGPDQVETDILGETQVLGFLPETYEALVAAYKDRFAKKALSAVAGRYEDAAGAPLALAADGRGALDGAPVRVEIRECVLDVAAGLVREDRRAGLERVACLELRAGKKRLLTLAAKPDGAGYLLAEGALVEGELSPYGLPFEIASSGRLFRAVP
jgi:hypothetical protein